MPYRFPKSRRLTTENEFKAVFDKPVKVSHKCLLALVKTNTTTHTRLGIIVGKRVAKQAVARNRIKRIIRESFRLNQPALSGADVLIIARPECKGTDNKNLRAYIDKLWQKLVDSPLR